MGTSFNAGVKCDEEKYWEPKSKCHGSAWYLYIKMLCNICIDLWTLFYINNQYVNVAKRLLILCSCPTYSTRPQYLIRTIYLRMGYVTIIYINICNLVPRGEYSRAGVANLSETKSHNFPCAAAKSHMRHMGTHAQKSSVYF